MSTQKKDVIDLEKAARIILEKKVLFCKVLSVVFVLSCVWIFAEPRYYKAEVQLAPEATGEDVAGGLASVASNFGINIGGIGASDAIYPQLYPDLFESTEFVVSLLDIRVKTENGDVDADYYTYMTKHQKRNWLKKPFQNATKTVKNWLAPSKLGVGGAEGKRNAFMLSERDFILVESVMQKIGCSVDKKTNVITINVKDQDRVICATLADSVCQRLQDFIIRYRTSKARLDVNYYQHLTDSSKVEYEKAMREYSRFCDTHQNVILQSYITERDKLENDMQLKFNTYSAMSTQLEAMKAEVQKRTPAFTVLKSATVPIRPAGPKRMIFVAGVLILASLVLALWVTRKEIFKKSSYSEQL